MASLFYPTENLSYTSMLGYYRQREWRIISGHYLHGKANTELATTAQVTELIEIDREFFSREMEFADGHHQIGAKCHFMNAGGRLLARVHRVIVPAECLARASDITAKYAPGITIQAA